MSAEECGRMLQLRRVFEKAIDASVHAINREHLDMCFADITEHYGGVLEDLSRQMLHTVSNHMNEEFDKVCEEMSVNEKLKQLDEMQPSGSEEEDAVSSTILRLKQLEKSKYEQAIQQMLRETSEQERQYMALLSQMQQQTDVLQAEAELIAQHDHK